MGSRPLHSNATMGTNLPASAAVRARVTPLMCCKLRLASCRASRDHLSAKWAVPRLPESSCSSKGDTTTPSRWSSPALSLTWTWVGEEGWGQGVDVVFCDCTAPSFPCKIPSMKSGPCRWAPSTGARVATYCHPAHAIVSPELTVRVYDESSGKLILSMFSRSALMLRVKTCNSMRVEYSLQCCTSMYAYRRCKQNERP